MKFRIEASINHTCFRVEFKGGFWPFWRSGAGWLNYFSLNYGSIEDAREAIIKYRDERYTEVTE